MRWAAFILTIAALYLMLTACLPEIPQSDLRIRIAAKEDVDWLEKYDVQIFAAQGKPEKIVMPNA